MICFSFWEVFTKISSLGDLQQTFTELETPSSAFVRSAANKLIKKDKEEIEENKKENGIINTLITNNRQPRANSNSKLARKNCFFSPLQCSFYYKSNSNFANMLMRGDE
uniref:Uncharacterized protein n=1 Tax=Meloidogyne enterolobii TaxID=390850 RepID=A0A6V7WX51_MELEN|nr:unnamed protein product [Meloidogyne enterolobii]